MTVTQVLGTEVIDIVTTSNITIARHRLAADGTGAKVRDHGHIYALEQVAMASANTGRPHRRKERIPPGPDALAAASKLRPIADAANPDADIRNQINSSAVDYDTTSATIYDLSIYERAGAGRNTLS